MSRRFGFTSKFLDKSSNNGKKSLYISLELGNEIFEDVFRKTLHLKNNFIATFIHRGQHTKYLCNFYFRKFTYGNSTEGPKQLYVTIGNCGSYGFAGGQSTQKETLSPYVVKQCLDQLYDFLEDYENNCLKYNLLKTNKI